LVCVLALGLLAACGGGGGGGGDARGDGATDGDEDLGTATRTPQWVVFSTDNPDGVYAVLDDGSGSPVELSAGLELVERPDVAGDRVLLRGKRPTDLLIQLYARNIDGTGLVRLSNLNNPDARVLSGNLSPDGSAVTFIADGETVGVFELYLAKLDGSATQRISGALNADENAGQHHWSPNGRYVAYAIRTSGGSSRAIGIYDTHADSRFRVDVPAPVDDLAWSPTSEKLAYILQERVSLKPAYQMYTLGVDGSSPVLSNGSLGGDHFLSSYAWSPDGQYLAQLFRLREAFETNQYAKAFVNLYDLSSPLSTRVVDFFVTLDNRNRGDCFSLCGFTWSHQGTELAYLSNHLSLSQLELFSYNIASGLDPKIQDGFPNDKTIRTVLGWTADETILVYRGGAASNVGELIEYADPSTAAPATRISEDANQIRSYEWSPDRERFFAIRELADEYIIEVREAQTFADATEILAPRWSQPERVLRQIDLSPDEENLVYLAVGLADSVSGQLRSTPVSGGPARLISGTLDVGDVIRY
jgi:Tol biopolymer transport system component